jgi:hypothetical protein
MSSDTRADARMPRSLLRRRPRGVAPPTPPDDPGPTPDPDRKPDDLGPNRPADVAKGRWTHAVDDWLTPSRAALVGLAALLELAVLWAVHGAMVDDGFISLDYARTLAFHGDWGAVPGIPSNTATSPLNVMLLAAITVVVRSPMAALWILAVANAAALAVGLVRLGQAWRVGDRIAWVAVPLLILNPVIASSTGLETAMTATLLVWLLDAAARGAWQRFGWLAGVGVVLRPDLVIVIAVVWLLHPQLRRPSALRTTAGTAWRAAVVGLPWFVFSWIYFGSAIPDTLVVKQNQSWGHFDVGLWQRYYHLFPWAITSVTIAAGIGLLVLLALPASGRTRFRPVALSVAACGLAGLAYYGVYTQLQVPPYFWYYGIPLASLTLVAAFGVCAASTALRQSAGRQWNLGRYAAAVAGVALLAPMVVTWASGLSDHAPLQEAPVHGNWALPSQYRQIGEDLAQRLPPGAVVRSAGEFGTILYYCHCTMIDRLDQRGLIMQQLLRAKHRSLPMRLNYLWLDPSKYPTLKQDFHLTYRNGRSDLADVWNVYGAVRRWGHFELEPGPRPRDAQAGLVP